MNRIFTLINEEVPYKVFGVAHSKHNGVSLLLQTKAGNWIVANGANIKSTKEEINEFGFAYGDWNHGHYFMGDENRAVNYFEAIKEGI